MAAVATIFGGLVGYVLAILTYFVFGTGLLTALVVWTFGGIGIVGLAIFAARLARPGHVVSARA